MLKTIEIEIDDIGKIHPLESLPFKPKGRALLTLLDKKDPSIPLFQGSAKKALELLASTRFANRPIANPEEVNSRITNLRTEWDKR